MPFTLRIAWRYLFALRNFNAVHVIAGISVAGISLGTAALILVLAVFNGLEVLLSDLMNAFNPDLKVVPVEGKFLEPEAEALAQIRELPGVAHVALSLEEIAFFEYGGRQDIGIIKGVDSNFIRVNDIENALVRGDVLFDDGSRYYAVMGLGMEYKLGVRVDDPFEVISVFMPRATASAGMQQSNFTRRMLQPSGVFALQQNTDAEYILTDIELVRDLLNRPESVSFLEVSLADARKENEVIAGIRNILGERVDVLNRYQQDAAFYRLLQLEKWAGFIILSLMIFLVTFNMMGALWMLVLDKKHDISMLKAMGATSGQVRKIFQNTGIILSLSGLLFGFFIALFLYGLQQTFGLVRLGDADQFLVDAYPMALQLSDFVTVGILVLFTGWLMSLLPARRAANTVNLIRND